MLATFEQALKRKCEQNPALSPLFSQWQFDQPLVANALQSVVRYFPHYSKHDASHSNTILERIERVLGPERIEALSATDLWLLLEAAYQHDIGMVVTDEQVREWWGTPDFKDYLAQLQHHSDPELREAAKRFNDRSPPQNLGHGWPIEVSRSVTLAIAEYARRKHAVNAERTIGNPERIGLQSPRTHLIHTRLFRLLGKICALHGGSFEDTMKLPARELGLGTDAAHPRFVAFMLRLGDLLDLDNGRFCPVSVRSFGALPASSMSHLEKHAATTHFWVSPEEIEVEAECESYEAYEATYQWFEWLRGELKNQIAHWADIKPTEDFGDLPSPKNIQVRLKGLLALEPGKRPRFEVDREQILKLVRGANIYTSRLGCMRELIQNAVDATLIRFWNEHWSRLPPEEMAKRTPRDLRRELKAYSIRVEFQRTRLEEGSKKARWRIVVQDQGTGISLNDVRYIQSIGASQRNVERQSLIREMPEWMRPSGAFGIGLQSVFLFTDKLLVRTRHYASNEALEMVLQNGLSSGTDGFTIRRLEGESARILVGTRVEFETDLDPALHGELVTFLARGPRFDPILEQEFPEEVMLADEVIQPIVQAGVCPIEVHTEKWPRPNIEGERLFDDCYFDPETHLEVVLEARRQASPFGVKFYYRGVKVSAGAQSTFDSALLSMDCNVHQGRADELLLLSREKFTEEGRQRVFANLKRALERIFPRYITALRERKPGSSELEIASLHAWLSQFEPAVTGEEWKAISIGGAELTLTLGTLVSQERVRYLSGKSTYGFDKVFIQDEAGKLTGNSLLYEGWWVWRFLVRSFPYHGFDAYEDSPGGWVGVHVFSRRSEDAVITRNGLRGLLRESNADAHWARMTIPCPAEYPGLRYTDGVPKDGFDHRAQDIHPRMVCPFTDSDAGIELPNLGKLVAWTARNAEGGPRSETEVAKALWDFIREVDTLMTGVWAHKAYDLDSARRELSRWLD